MSKKENQDSIMSILYKKEHKSSIAKKKRPRMDSLKSKATLLNAISNIVLQIATIISNFIIPRLILSSFGSDVNGLITSLNQFLGYISIIDGGITGVIMVAFYGPLAKRDNDRLNAVFVTARKFYNKIGLIFILYAIALAIIYPLAFTTGFSFMFVASLILILSFRYSVQYLFSLTYKTLLNADKKVYIVSLTQAMLHLIEVIVSIIAINIFPNIHLLKLLTVALFSIQPFIFSLSVKKYYSIDTSVKPDKSLLKSRWDGFAVNTAAFIHNGTDVAVLTIFTNLASVSVYSVYALITNGIKSIIKSLLSNLDIVIGHSYALKNSKDLNQKADLYEYITFMLVCFLFGVASLLITPFVMLYTHGVTDANYYHPFLGILLIVSEALYLVKLPHLCLAYSANRFKDVSKPAFIEAGLNIIISIALVPFLGLIGVAIGTLVAMLYRLVFHVYYTTKIIPGRHQWIFYRKLLIFTTSTITSIGLCLLIPSPESTIVSWLWHAASYSAVIGTSLAVVSLLFFRPELKFLKHYLRKK